MATEIITKVQTPVFRASYCNLWTPDKHNKFKVTAIIDFHNLSAGDKARFDDMVKLVEEVKNAKFPKMKDYTVKDWLKGKRGQFKLPFRTGGEVGVDWLAGEDYKGKIVCPLISGPRNGVPSQVGILDLGDNKRKLDPNDPTDRTLVYSGCYMIATIKAYAYDNEGQGVAFSLQSLAKVKDGSPLGNTSDPSEDFKDVDADEYGANNAAAFDTDYGI